MMPDVGLELWGGIECTVARVGDGYRDQVGMTGHHHRPEDLDRVAHLGIRTLRYPVLWEALSPDITPDRGWSWHDARLNRIRDLGIRPIVGLLHHGSGPRDTSLLHGDFPERLAVHARAVAERYPWVNDYTPVNEPLTTARFSALYGHWYPHRRSYPDFLRALVNQCRATVLSMEAIRAVNPDARLIQTEDLGRAFSTPALGYQAEHENERRWLTFDLLFGRVDQRHPWWRILLDNGISVDELEAFLSATPPDMIGINHYLTSDRYLDDERAGYPEHLWGDNGRHLYADAEAVRVRGFEDETGMASRLREVSARYPVPIAITEVHHGCTREEQLRWLAEVWHAAEAVRCEGVDVRAVTVWSLFGACDWNSLLTRADGIYEPGAFDIRGPSPRLTALGAAAASLARGGTVNHPVLAGPGWWHRPDRYYGPSRADTARPWDTVPTLGILGAPGPLLDECCHIARQRGLAYTVMTPSAEIVPPDRHVWAILDLSLYGPRAAIPGSLSARLDYAARARRSYIVVVPAGGDPGAARIEDVEATVAQHHRDALVVVAGTLFGPVLPTGLLGHARPGLGVPGAFSYLPDLVHVALDLLVDGERGTWRLVNHPAGATAGCEDGSRLMPPLESALARLAHATAAWDGARLAAAE